MSKQLDCDIKELSSTLMFVAIKETEFIIAHIGDGVVGYLKENELRIASQPENGEFTNTTIFTTSKDALTTMKLIKGNLGGINGFVLMSDGTEISLYNKKEKKLADVLKKIMNFCIVIPTEKIEEQLLNSFETIIKQSTTDDCSIVLMINDKNVFPGYKNLCKNEKSKLLDVPTLVSKKCLKRYDDILINLEKEQTLQSISRIIHLKPKYTRKYLDKLMRLNLIEKRRIRYQTIVLMTIQEKE